MTFGYQDIAGTLATEEAVDAAQVAKLRSALESVDHKRRKVLYVFLLLYIMHASACNCVASIYASRSRGISCV